MEQWKQLAEAEPNERRRSDYGGLALVFAEAADRRELWAQSLKGWNVRQSQQVLEWQAEARKEGRSETLAQTVLRTLALRYPTAVTADLSTVINALTEEAKLLNLFDAAVTSSSLGDFRQYLQTLLTEPTAPRVNGTAKATP